METEAPVCQTIGFLLLDQFTLISLSCAVEPLRMANQLAGEELYHWQTLSLDGQPVWASDGVSVTPDACAQDQRGFDAVIVCGGVGIQQAISPALIACFPRKTRPSEVTWYFLTKRSPLTKATTIWPDCWPS